MVFDYIERSRKNHVIPPVLTISDNSILRVENHLLTRRLHFRAIQVKLTATFMYRNNQYDSGSGEI